MSYLYLSGLQASNTEDSDYPYISTPRQQLRPAFDPGDDILGRYRVEDILHGGIGLIYKCRDRITGKAVALKTVMERHKQYTGEFSPMSGFRKELLFRLYLPEHPNILKLQRAEFINGYLYLVSDWQPLSLNKLESITFPKMIHYLHDIAKGLLYLHNKGYVLEDLKPDNIFITTRQSAMIGDFSYHASTPEYMSPEQFNGLETTKQTDIYSFGKLVEYLWRHLSDNDKNTLSDNGLFILNEITANCCGGNLIHPELSHYDIAADLRYASFEEVINKLITLAKTVDIELFPVPDSLIRYNYDLDKIYTELIFGLDNRYAMGTAMQPITSGGTLNMSMNQFIDPNRFILDAEILRRKGEYQKALAKLTSTPKKTHLWYYVKGLTELDSGNMQEAVNTFLTITEPLHLNCINKGLDLLMDRDPVTASSRQKLKTLIGYMDSHPLISDGFYPYQVLGKIHYLLGNYKQAAEAFRESLCYPCTEYWYLMYLYALNTELTGNTSLANEIYAHTLKEITKDNLRGNSLQKTYIEKQIRSKLKK